MANFLSKLDPNLKYIVGPRCGLSKEGLSRKFIQLGNFFTVDATTRVESLAVKLELAIEIKLMKQYQIEYGDIIYLMYRVEGFFQKKKPKKIDIISIIRKKYGKIPAKFLTNGIAPFSMNDEFYGDEIIVIKDKQKIQATLYQKNKIIIRESIGDNSVNVKVYEKLISTELSPYEFKNLYEILTFIDTKLPDGFERKFNELKLFFAENGKLRYYEASLTGVKLIKPKIKGLTQKGKPFMSTKVGPSLDPQRGSNNGNDPTIAPKGDLSGQDKPVEKKIDCRPIIVGDIETYQEGLNLIPCAIGWYNGKDLVTFILKEQETTENLLKRAFEFLLKKENNKSIVYMHNLAGFDFIYIFKYLEKNGYYVKPIFKENNTIIEMKVGGPIQENKENESPKVKIKKPDCTVTFRDSYLILPENLKKLTENCNVQNKKKYFPYKALNKATLFYKGQIPPMSDWEEVPLDYFNQIKHQIWDFQFELKNYLENDLLGLHQVITLYRENFKEK